jgi:hypothetical protein
MTYQRRRQKDPLEAEADLYSAIATMDKLSNYFDKGYVGETLYRRQLKSCISDVFQARRVLESTGFEVEEFIEEQNLREKYPEGLRRLDLAVGSEENEIIGVKALGPIVENTANYVANAIELIDLLKLRSVAKVEYIVPLLDDMFDILSAFPGIGGDYWSVVEIDGWRSELMSERPSKVLSEADCEKLEFDAARWLNDFRKKTKEL